MPRSTQLADGDVNDGRKKCCIAEKLFRNVIELVKPIATHVLQPIKFEMEYVGWSRRIIVNTKRQATEMPIVLPKRISESVMKYHSGSAEERSAVPLFVKAIRTRQTTSFFSASEENDSKRSFVLVAISRNDHLAEDWADLKISWRMKK